MFRDILWTFYRADLWSLEACSVLGIFDPLTYSKLLCFRDLQYTVEEAAAVRECIYMGFT